MISDNMLDSLMNLWERETALISSPPKMLEHRCGKEIIAMGKPVIPMLLARIRRHPHLCMGALSRITSQNPVPSQHKGHVEKMVEAWISWGKKTPHLDIYTDGAAVPSNPGPGGWACILIANGVRREFNGYGGHEVTNNQMEIRAIRQGLEQVKGDFIGSILISTDSQWSIGAHFDACIPTDVDEAEPKTPEWDEYAAIAVQGEFLPTKIWNIKKNVKAVNEIKDMLAALVARGCKIRFKWVRGHVGDEWNERCDVLANESCRHPEWELCDSGYILQTKTDSIPRISDM